MSEQDFPTRLQDARAVLAFSLNRELGIRGGEYRVRKAIDRAWCFARGLNGPQFFEETLHFRCLHIPRVPMERNCRQGYRYVDS